MLCAAGFQAQWERHPAPEHLAIASQVDHLRPAAGLCRRFAAFPRRESMSQIVTGQFPVVCYTRPAGVSNG